MPQIIGKERNGGAAAFPAPFFRCIGGACRGAAEICLEAIGIAAHGKAFPASDETLLSGRLKLLDPRADLACRIEPISRDRKSTRLNSSHVKISYAVFCLKKKTNNRAKTATWAL